MNISRILLPLAMVLLVAATVSAQEESPATNLSVNDVLADFDAAWSLIDEGFYDPRHRGMDWEAVKGEYRPRVEAADSALEAYEILTDMIESLDSPNTSIVPPWDVPPLPEQPADNTEPLLEYAGVGIRLAPTTEGEILVLEVFREAPAEEAGALVGDIIVGVDDWRVEGEDPMDEVVSRVRGVVGTDVDLTLRDPDGEERTITVTRGQIDLTPSVQARVLPSGTGYIRVPALTPGLVEEASKSLPSLLSTRNLILDLRSVSSGNLDAMGTLARWFLGSAQIGGFLTAAGPQQFPVPQDAIAAYQRTMTVLTNPGTSGVAEMLAMVLRTYRRAGLVGGATSGGSEFSQVGALPSGGVLSVALARYLAPDGSFVPNDGLEPDIAVELPDLATVRSGRDVYIEAAVEAMRRSPRW